MELVATEEPRAGRRLIDELLYDGLSGPDVIVFLQDVQADEDVNLGVAFHDRVERSAGLSVESVAARICVEYSVSFEGVPTVMMTDIECPGTLPRAVGNNGTIDITVRLNE